MGSRRFRRLSLVLIVSLLGLVAGLEPAVAAPRCGGQRATITAKPGAKTKGTPRADVIVGTPKRDVINGLGGGDRICGGDGNDLLNGGSGDDAVFGGEGPDVLVGARGNDVLTGNGDNDLLVGDAATPPKDVAQATRDLQAPSDDLMIGGDGDDTALGGGGQNDFDGGSGDNTCANAAPATNCAGPPPGAPTATPIVATFSAPVTTYTFDVTDPDGEPLVFKWSKGPAISGDDRDCGSFTFTGEVASWSHAHEPPDNCPSESVHPAVVMGAAVDDIGWQITNMYTDGSAEGTSSYGVNLSPPVIKNWEG